MCALAHAHACVCVCVCTRSRACIYVHRHIHEQIISNRYAKMVNLNAEPSGRTLYGVDLRLLAFWDCGFESRRWHGCLSCNCSVLSGTGLCDGPITGTEESYRVKCFLNVISKLQHRGVPGRLALSSHGKLKLI